MKVGTIGTSFITEWLIQAMQDNGVEVVACYSRSEEKGKNLADKFNVQKVYTDFNEMLKDKEINFIYVASPNSLHYSYTKLALNSGKNVICEKPFFSNARETKEMIELAKEKHLMLFEAITVIHNPNVNRMKELLDTIKPIKIVEANMSQYSRKYDAFLNGEHPNVFTTKYSGGALMDINIYNLHFVLHIFGMPEKVNYIANIKEGIDTSGIVTLRYPNFVCSLVGSKDNIGYNFAQIQGENGYIKGTPAISICNNVDYQIRKNGVTYYNLLEDKDSHYYEVKAMKEIYDNQDYQECYRLLEHSLNVMQVVDMLKKDANIKFDND